MPPLYLCICIENLPLINYNCITFDEYKLVCLCEKTLKHRLLFKYSTYFFLSIFYLANYLFLGVILLFDKDKIKS